MGDTPQTTASFYVATFVTTVEFLKAYTTYVAGQLKELGKVAESTKLRDDFARFEKQLNEKYMPKLRAHDYDGAIAEFNNLVKPYAMMFANLLAKNPSAVENLGQYRAGRQLRSTPQRQGRPNDVSEWTLPEESPQKEIVAAYTYVIATLQGNEQFYSTMASTMIANLQNGLKLDEIRRVNKFAPDVMQGVRRTVSMRQDLRPMAAAPSAPPASWLVGQHFVDMLKVQIGKDLDVSKLLFDKTEMLVAKLVLSDNLPSMMEVLAKLQQVKTALQLIEDSQLNVPDDVRAFLTQWSKWDRMDVLNDNADALNAIDTVLGDVKGFESRLNKRIQELSQRKLAALEPKPALVPVLQAIPVRLLKQPSAVIVDAMALQEDDAPLGPPLRVAVELTPERSALHPRWVNWAWHRAYLLDESEFDTGFKAHAPKREAWSSGLSFEAPAVGSTKAKVPAVPAGGGEGGGVLNALGRMVGVV